MGLVIARPSAAPLPAFDRWPEIGQWFNVYDDEDERPYLACCSHVGSNHALFNLYMNGENWSRTITVMEPDFERRLKPAADWQDVINGRIEGLRLMLAEKVKEIADKCAETSLLRNDSAQHTNALVAAPDINAHKKELVTFQDVT